MSSSKNEHDAPQYDPTAFVRYTRRNSDDGTVGYVFGVTPDDQCFVQTVRFKAAVWTAEAAIRYLELNNFRTDTFEAALPTPLEESAPKAKRKCKAPSAASTEEQLPLFGAPASVPPTKRASPTRSAAHTCHAVGCRKRCPPEYLMCGPHWSLVPRELQTAVWQTYRTGQCDDGTPSDAWHEAADRAIEAVAQLEGKRRRMPPQQKEPDDE